MTNPHPITPPSELIEKVSLEALAAFPDEEGGAVEIDEARDEYIAIFFSRWGADRQLEACLRYAGNNGLSLSRMRDALRPKPPSLRQQALSDLSRLMSKQVGIFDGRAFDTIRRALEQLPDDRPKSPTPAEQGLHSYKVGEAEPIDGWGLGHTPVNPEAAMAELRAASAEARPGGLVERMGDKIADTGWNTDSCDPEARKGFTLRIRAAIREVAAWLKQQQEVPIGCSTASADYFAAMLEEEADRG